ncbi:hypothetical protein LINPERPRIM_LOCUS14990 [Linum perenne]
MVHLNAKNKNKASVQLNYIIHIEEIKHWPPSQSLRSLRSVLIQWENGGRHSGTTHTVVPTLGTIVGDGKIEFNESFRLPVTLLKSSKGRDGEAFQKNNIVFNLCEPRRDKAQLLAKAVIDLEDYGVLKETVSATAPMKSTRSFTNTSHPVLFIKIQPVLKDHRVPKVMDGGLSRGVSLDKNAGDSVSVLMNEEYAEEAELASFTDDDVSSQCSFKNRGFPAFQKKLTICIEFQNGPDRRTDSNGGAAEEIANTNASQRRTDKITYPQEVVKGNSSPSSSIDLSSGPGSPINGDSSSVLNLRNEQILQPTSSSITNDKVEYGETRSDNNRDLEHKDGVEFEITESLVVNRVPVIAKDDENSTSMKEVKGSEYNENEQIGENIDETTDSSEEDPAGSSFLQATAVKEASPGSEDTGIKGNIMKSDRLKHVKYGSEYNKNEQSGENIDETTDSSEEDPAGSSFLQATAVKEASPGSEDTGMKGNIMKSDRLKHVKSVRSMSDSIRNSGGVSINHHETKELNVLDDQHISAGGIKAGERRSAKIHPKDSNTMLDGKFQQLAHKVKMLEGELREAAAIETALYSVVAEHGSSISKVHAPARRLSRMYLHVSGDDSYTSRGSAARSAVSGLVLVAKSCGNDVPRLTFWLSNSVVLRAIISQAVSESLESKGGQMGNSPLNWKELSSSKKAKGSAVFDNSGDWENPRTFLTALERVEAWIFSKTVESIWWQTLTPHMQSAVTKGIDGVIDSDSRRNLGRSSSSCDQVQVNFSLELWKNAFKDACERLCPVRAGGHECGCLPELARLVMEQCVARLDVAMFNAILRESADEIPTDPVSDPISDPMVLPIPAGISSFGAGAQLKNAIGNWSRWLTDLFGLDDDDDDDEGNSDPDEDDHRQETSFKSFYLLNALSDLMMLPKDLLLSRTIRKEVCPTFGTPLIKRILYTFASDEFCPDPVPTVVLKALESEDNTVGEEGCVATVPCIAASPVYIPPSSSSVADTIGVHGSESQLRKSGSSVLRKSYTSDDELDELKSPLASLFPDAYLASPAAMKPAWRIKEEGQNPIRYDLLKDIWRNS